jgi:type IV secretory pathway VirB4 component
MIDDERRKHFEQERGHFESRHALVLTYRPPERQGDRAHALYLFGH